MTGITSTTAGGGTGRGQQIHITLLVLSWVSLIQRQVWYYNSVTAENALTVGLSTNTVTYYDGTNYNNFNLEPDGDGDVLNGIGSGLDVYFLPDNLHGLKLYDEPYAKDRLDSFRGVGVGTIGIGTMASENYMTILTPDRDIDIQVGQIVTPSISGYFCTQSVTVTSVGTTICQLAIISIYGYFYIKTTKSSLYHC